MQGQWVVVVVVLARGYISPMKSVQGGGGSGGTGIGKDHWGKVTEGWDTAEKVYHRTEVGPEVDIFKISGVAWTNRKVSRGMGCCPTLGQMSSSAQPMEDR